MIELYGCFDDEMPPLSFTGYNDNRYASFKIVPVPFSRLRSNSIAPNTRRRAKSI
jgi:hypothetical protein